MRGCLWAFTIATLGLRGSAAAQTGFEQALPADTLFFAGCADVEDLRSGFARSRLGGLLADPASGELRDWLNAVLDRLDEVARHAAGAGTLEFASLLHGRIALAAFGEPRVAKDRIEGVALALLADTGANQEGAADFVDRLAEGLTPWLGGAPRHETVDGTEVITVPADGAPSHVRLRLALHGTTLVAVVEMLPMATDALATLLEGLDRPPADGLASSPHFLETLAAGPGGGVRAWIDLDRGWDAVRPAVPIYLTRWFDQLRPVVDCERLGCAAMRSTFEPDGLRTRLSFDFALRGPGVDVMEAFRRPTSTRLLGEAPTDAYTVSVGSVDASQLFKGLIASLEAGKVASAAQVNGFVGQVESALDAPIDTLLEALDGEWAIIGGPAGQSGTLPAALAQGHQLAVLIGLQDAAPVGRLAGALAQPDGPLPGFQSFELDGQPCFRVARWTISVCGSVQSGLLALSTSEDLLGDVLRQVRSPDGGSLNDDARLRARLAALSPGWANLSVTDAASSVRDLFASLAQWKAILASAPDRADYEWLDVLFDVPALDPDVLQRHLGVRNVSGGTVGREGSRSESLQF